MNKRENDTVNQRLSNNQEENSSRKYSKWFGTIALSVLLFCVGYGVVLSGCEERGTFGDMFGAVGALFSGLAFAGVIVTMLQQSETLKLQRKDLRNQTETIELQRQEIANTNKELQEQNKTIRLQRFENTFFNMLEMQQEILKSVTVFRDYLHRSYTNGEKEELRNRDELHGHSAISKLWEDFLFARKNDKGRTNAINHFESYLSDKRYIVPYFRQIFQIVTFVDKSDNLTLDEKHRYIGIIRDTLSSDEISLIFYYVISKSDNQRYKQLIEKYALFEHIGDSVLVDPNHRGLYEDGAYRSMPY